jgi:hypothetical protein
MGFYIISSSLVFYQKISIRFHLFILPEMIAGCLPKTHEFFEKAQVFFRSQLKGYVVINLLRQQDNDLRISSFGPFALCFLVPQYIVQLSGWWQAKA